MDDMIRNIEKEQAEEDELQLQEEAEELEFRTSPAFLKSSRLARGGL